MKKTVSILFLLSAMCAAAQNYHGTTGLLQVQNAETDSAGTFVGGAAFLHKAMMPDMSYYGGHEPFNAPCYTVGITAFRWLQLSYTGTLVKTHGGKGADAQLKYYNEDRHINVKLSPLYEGRWWPAIAIGWDDVGNLKSLKLGGKSMTTNNFFECLYVAASKRFDISGYELGAHIAYRHYPSYKNKERRGMAGGLTLRPAFYRPLRFVAEWDGTGVNVGADALLWRHLFVQVALVHGRGFMGGVSYHYKIPF